MKNVPKTGQGTTKIRLKKTGNRHTVSQKALVYVKRTDISLNARPLCVHTPARAISSL